MIIKDILRIMKGMTRTMKDVTMSVTPDIVEEGVGVHLSAGLISDAGGHPHSDSRDGQAAEVFRC